MPDLYFDLYALKKSVQPARFFPKSGSCKQRKNPQNHCGSKDFSGDPAEIRTPDTLLKRQVLCRLSYWVTYPASSHTADRWGFRAGLKWQGWLDSNQR